ncbi:MAG: 50S ribosomal protein L6, partial [Bacteroidales bacterium]|nr:50S ribosomal protein L6 [Bacteroidales bacterium]
MSRIGKLPINIPAGTSIEVDKNNLVTVKGSNGELTQQVDTEIKVSVEENKVVVSRPTDQIRHKALHGLYRSLLNNMIEGVSKGFTIQQEIVGVGYKAETRGQLLDLTLGYSHHIFFELPNEVKVEVQADRKRNPIITLKSADKQLIGQVAYKIRSLRKPEPYKGKGIK